MYVTDMMLFTHPCSIHQSLAGVCMCAHQVLRTGSQSTWTHYPHTGSGPGIWDPVHDQTEQHQQTQHLHHNLNYECYVFR